MIVHVVDGTYELFRHYYAVPSSRDRSGREIGAVRGVLTSLRSMLASGATHVDDAADGFPGLPGWGAKSTATVLARYVHLEEIPRSARDWDVRVAGAARLPEILNGASERALLFRGSRLLRPIYRFSRTLTNWPNRCVAFIRTDDPLDG